MIYLKTCFSASHEVKFLKLNLRESLKHIDKFIICEFNRTHTGVERELIFNKYFDDFTEQEKKKIIYIGADISKYTQFSITDGNITRRNEILMQGYFVKELGLNNQDIVFSVDADEIIYSHMYQPIIKKINFFNPCLLLKLNLFFYKINYLWVSNEFKAPVACKVGFYKNRYPSSWRYEGKLFPITAGCHFSWCLTIDEMIDKLGRYIHTDIYGHFAKREILEDAVKNKKYPFESKQVFDINVLDLEHNKNYYPQAIYSMLNEFNYLIGQ